MADFAGTVFGMPVSALAWTIILGLITSAAVAVWFERRHKYQKDIISILKRCRETEGWDDKSESKLYQWMLDVPEDQLHNCSLPKLYRIRKSMSDYLHVQLWGWDSMPAPGWIELRLRSILLSMETRRYDKVHDQKNCKGRKKPNRKQAMKKKTYLIAERID